MPLTITILGNNSGRNAGDNAILGNILNDFSMHRSDILFKIPTLNYWYIKRNFSKYNIKPMGMLPWNLALKNFGLPLYRAMTNTDIVLITDNILFDRKLNNPIFNNLKSISLFSSFCKRKGIPIVLYNASIGPIDTEKGFKALQKVIDATQLIITRDESTLKLIESNCNNYPEIIVNADSALNSKLISDDELNKIIAKEKLFNNEKGSIGLNVNAYLGNWSKKSNKTENEICSIIANTADNLINKLGVDIIFTVTQIMDLKITMKCVNMINNRNNVRVISNKDYNYNELATILSKLDVHAGLRTHTLIFCAISGTPMISINSYPKSVAFMETIGMGEWNISPENMTAFSLSEILLKLWHNKVRLKQDILSQVSYEKEKARSSAGIVLGKFCRD